MLTDILETLQRIELVASGIYTLLLVLVIINAFHFIISAFTSYTSCGRLEDIADDVDAIEQDVWYIRYPPGQRYQDDDDDTGEDEEDEYENKEQPEDDVNPV